MTREEYQKEYLESFIREEYDSMVWGGNCFTDHVRKIFNAGIQCGDTMPKPGLVDLSQVWHDASERPEPKVWFIAQIGKKCFDTFIVKIDKNDSWVKWSMGVNITRWAYIEDLLPKKE